jgi:T5SS/PEP-CTERM-associated repeat protein
MVYIGNNTTGKGSLTILNGGFLNGYTIYVGSQGAGSSLIISNGGRVRNGYGYIGYNVGNNSNSAIVTGSGSSWTNTSEFMVGRNGSANSLTIANSGIVYSANSTIGFFTNTRSNTVTVTDSGSVWRNGGYLIVGLSGSSNQLTIADGGRVFNTHGSIGSNSAANGNAVLVTGSGSLWTNSGNVYVSCSGVGNSLTIEDGGRVTAQAMYIGLNGGSSGTLTINNGTNILSSSLTVGNAANSTGAVWLSGGFLCTSNNAVFIGNYGRGQMTVSNGSWLASDAYVGFRGGSQGTLTIAGGATILSSVLSVGTDANSTGTVWLTGGQLVTTNYSAAVGSSGVGEMTVSNGSWLAQAVNVGATASSRGTLTIAGGVTDLRSGLSIAYGAVFLTGGQLVTTNDSVWIGNFGSGRMIVSNGTWFAKDVCVGYGGYSVGLSGMLLVHGGAIGLAGPLTVGSDGAGYLTISGGVLGLHPDVATATNGTGFNVDGSVTLNDGRILVSNVATRIGNVATGTLTINGGTMTVFAPFTVGATSSATGTVLVAGGHLDLSATTTLIGPACLGQLIVTNTGVVTLGNVTIGPDGTLTVAGGTLLVGDTLSDTRVSFLGGTVGVLPDGVLQLSHDIALLVTNQGDIQVSASLSLLGGLQNFGNLSVNAAQVIKVENQMANTGSGVLYLNNGGILDVGPAWTNAGAIAFSQGGRLKGGSVANDGLLEGSGAISAPLLNRAGGTVRAANGVLALTGASVANDPGAFMEAGAGGTLRFSQSLNNQGTVRPQGGVMDFQSNTLTNSGLLAGYGTLKAALIVNQGRATFQGGETAIQSVYLNAAGATTEVLHASISFFYAFTNASGAYFKNTGSQITFFGIASIGGTYVSDPAMNIFQSALNLSGVLAGGAGDVFVFNDDLTSTNPDGLQLAGAKVVFNAGAHTFTLAGPAQIGELELQSGASLLLAGGDLIVGLLSAQTNQFTTAQTIYYDPAQNPSLGAQTYALNGGGSLTAVPEPSSALLLLLAVAVVTPLCRRVTRKRAN